MSSSFSCPERLLHAEKEDDQQMRLALGAGLWGWGQHITGAGILSKPDQTLSIAAGDAKPGFWNSSSVGLCKCHDSLLAEPGPSPAHRLSAQSCPASPL